MIAATSRWLRLLPVLLACVAIGAVPRLYGAQPQGSALFAAAPGIETAQSGAQSLDSDSPLPTQKVLRRALRADPRQEYFVYVPSAGGRGAPLFVAVHGISRNAQEHATLFSDYAEAYGVVLLAPYFTEARNDDYQRLGRVGRGSRADVVLDSIIEEVASLTGAAAEKIYLFGFSGGAQFAHRYTMAHPQRVARAVVAAAGWYTFPDARTPYPYGIGPSQDLPSLRFDPERFLRVPIAVFVGEQDITNESLRRNAEVDRQQGVTRFERARNWVAAMRAAADAHHLDPLVSYEQVAGIHHSFKQFMQQGRLGDRVFEAMFGPPSPKKPRADDGAGANEQRSGSRPRQRPVDETWDAEATPELLACSIGGER